MSQKISFSHVYRKLIDPRKPTRFVSKAVLLLVMESRIAELPPDFLNYDTHMINDERYDLSKLDKVLILFFRKRPTDDYPPQLLADLFTTVRPYSQDKARYYYGCVGKEFDVHVKGHNPEDSIANEDLVRERVAKDIYKRNKK